MEGEKNDEKQINIEMVQETESAHIFAVQVVMEDETHTFTVEVDKDYSPKLIGESGATDELVRESFVFLLNRESVGSILREFNVSVISEYFPEYEKVMKECFGKK